MTEHHARCACGAVTLACRGDPIRTSACHCRNCQSRSGSAFAAQARWPAEAMTVTGDTRTFQLTGDAGGVATFRFCTACGVTCWFSASGQPGVVAVPIGLFADPHALPRPSYSVYESRKWDWVSVEADQHYG